MKPRIVVLMFGHKAQTGKDLSCKYLVNNSLDDTRRYFKRYAFADKLKEAVADLYGFSHKQMHGDLKDVEDKRYPNLIDEPATLTYKNDDPSSPIVSTNSDYKPFLTPRRVLQIFGQNQRALYPNIWASYIFRQMDAEADLYSSAAVEFRCCISDFRFQNEYDVAYNWSLDQSKCEKFLYTVKMERPGIVGVTGAGDVSENDLNDFKHWNFIINNDGSIEDLYSKVSNVWQAARKQ